MENRVFEPEVELEHDERSALAILHSMDGYRVLHRVMRAAVDRFLLDLINADPGNHEAVLARHNLAKAAAQFYSLVTERVNEEVQLYVKAPRLTDRPVDLTESILDIGALASRMADIDRERDLEEGQAPDEY